ncbi:hypothetical protein DFH29DRAFT_871091 [Suillus ampliporus]|nr:hypothetical protein DFH29DRAFT_871091 [Suillus ampliporus]
MVSFIRWFMGDIQVFTFHADHLCSIRENAEPEVTGCDIQKFQHVKTFADSLIFMIMKGTYHAVNDLPVPALPSSSLQTLSPKHKFPSLQPLGGKAHDTSTSAADCGLSSAMHDMSISQTVDQSSDRSSSSCSLPHARSSSQSPPYIHHLVRTLAGVVDSVSVAAQTNTGNVCDLEDFPPPGILGIDADRYLHAHGYKASAVWSIIHAFKDAYGPDDFMAYVCPKGMPVLEAAYIYELISGRDVCDFRYLKTTKKYADALTAAQDVVMQEAIKLREKFATNTVEYFYEAILQNARTKGKRRGRNHWNAYLRGELKKCNNELDPMEPRLKASDIAPELSREWKSMSKEEKEHLTKDYMDDLEEYRANKSLAVHNVAINSFHDVCSTLDSISVQLSELAARTGEAIFLVAVCGDSDHSYTYQAVRVPVPKMFYSNFDTQITAKHGVVVDNWPLKNFVSPSDIGSTMELRVLHNTLKTGVMTFRKMTHDEWEQWDKERFQSALLQHDNVDECHDVSSTGGIEVAVHKKRRKERSDKGKKRGPRDTASS